MAHPVICDSVAPQRSRRISKYRMAVLPCLAALFFSVYGLRELSNRNLYSDAPNHVLNGALIADWIRSNNLTRPVAFAMNYYGRLPAITIPFHPPVFPAIEGLAFLLFGTSVPVARILIAVMVALAVVLLYRFAAVTTGSGLAAICAAIAFFAMRSSTYLASNVMLEMPALVFVLAALYQLRRLDDDFRLRDALSYALLASIALWTKQQAVFLGLVPFAYIALSRRWRLLLRKEIWIISGIFGAAVYGFTTLTGSFSGAGGAHEIPGQSYIARTFFPRAVYYLKAIAETLGPIVSFWVVLAILYALWQPAAKKRNLGLDLHLVWACCAFAVLFLTGHLDPRYLFFIYPPLIVLAFLFLERCCKQFLPDRWAWSVPAVVTAICLAAIPGQPSTSYTHGPAEAADYIVDGRPHRILYCGNLGTGNFILSVRTLDANLRNTVIRASSLGDKFTSADIDNLAHKYAIDRIVVPEPAAPQICDTLRYQLPATMVLNKEISLDSSDARLDGKIKIYRFTNPAATPERQLKIRVRKLQKDFYVELDD